MNSPISRWHYYFQWVLNPMVIAILFRVGTGGIGWRLCFIAYQFSLTITQWWAWMMSRISVTHQIKIGDRMSDSTMSSDNASCTMWIRHTYISSAVSFAVPIIINPNTFCSLQSTCYNRYNKRISWTCNEQSQTCYDMPAVQNDWRIIFKFNGHCNWKRLGW